MAHRPQRRRRTFFAADNYARFAMGSPREPGSSLADPWTYAGARDLSWMCFPSVEEELFDVVCEDEGVRALLHERLILAYQSRDLWQQPNISMEFQSWVNQLMHYGVVYRALAWETEADGKTVELVAVDWMAPETILERRRYGKRVYEQYAHQRAFTGSGMHVSEGFREFLVELAEDEVLRLNWPLEEPQGTSPVANAYRLHHRLERASRRSLAAMRAAAEPDESFWAIARARIGAYGQPGDTQADLSAAVADRMYVPPGDGVTEYFAVDRNIRVRVAAVRVRDHVLAAFNEQVLGRWCKRNSWPDAALALRPVLWSETDWTELWHAYRTGVADWDDVVAAVQAESEAGRAVMKG